MLGGQFDNRRDFFKLAFLLSLYILRAEDLVVDFVGLVWVGNDVLFITETAVILIKVCVVCQL